MKRLMLAASLALALSPALAFAAPASFPRTWSVVGGITLHAIGRAAPAT
jgi:hypothetical protein